MSINSVAVGGNIHEGGNLDELILGDYPFTLNDVLRILETRSEITQKALDDERVQQILRLEVVSALKEIIGGEGLTQEDRDKMNFKKAFEDAKSNAETQLRIEQEFESLAWNKNNDPQAYTDNYLGVIKELYNRIPEASFESPLSGSSGFMIQHMKGKNDRGFNHLFVSGEEIIFDDITKDFYMMRRSEILRVDLNYIYCSTFGKNHPFAR